MVSNIWKINQRGSFSAVRPATFAILILILATLSCAFERLTNPPATPTPVSQTGADYLSYDVPNYRISISPGERVPGTGLEYVSRSNDVYNLAVDGAPLPSSGKTQVVWEGIIKPSVFARYNLQVTPEIVSDALNFSGPVRLVILRPDPTEIAGPPSSISGANHYSGILIGETAAVGQKIAGTSLQYDGERSGSAAFSGTLQTALRPLGSSFIWYGRLLDNVFVKHTLTVNDITTESVRLEGTAEIWIFPSR